MIPYWPFPPGSEGRSFASGDQSPDRIRLAFFRAEGDHRLHARVWLGPRAEGPPGHAHGGAIGAVLDEAMGGACWMHGHMVVAARFSVDFRAPVRLAFEGTAESWIERVEGRKIYVRACLRAAGGTVVAESDGLFVQVTPSWASPRDTRTPGAG